MVEKKEIGVVKFKPDPLIRKRNQIRPQNEKGYNPTQIIADRNPGSQQPQTPKPPGKQGK